MGRIFRPKCAFFLVKKLVQLETGVSFSSMFRSFWPGDGLADAGCVLALRTTNPTARAGPWIPGRKTGLPGTPHTLKLHHGYPAAYFGSHAVLRILPGQIYATTRGDFSPGGLFNRRFFSRCGTNALRRHSRAASCPGAGVFVSRVQVGGPTAAKTSGGGPPSRHPRGSDFCRERVVRRAESASGTQYDPPGSSFRAVEYRD